MKDGIRGQTQVSTQSSTIKKGLSIKAIQKKLGVSRSSVSLWVRDIELTKKQVEKLYLNKRTGGLKGSFIAARNKIESRKKLTEEIMTAARKGVGELSDRDKFLTGVAMYFAEGSKRDGTVAFSNSDPRAIEFMTRWFREICNVPEDKFRCYLYIHDNLNESKAKKFWSALTSISLNQFRKSYVVKNNPNRFRKTKNVYGVLRISVSDANLHRKIMGWISGVFGL